MSKFDRYLFVQFLQLFGFFSLVLVAVYWVNRAVGLFDQLIGDGESVKVFLEFSILTLPNAIRLVLPISAFAAGLYAVNRLTRDSELVVMQATGFSSSRMSRPVLFFGLCVLAVMLVLTNVLVPLSQTRLDARTAELGEDITARFLVEGRFMHPASGVTVYIRQITPQGELNDLFLDDERNPARKVTYTARQALIARGQDGPRLIMLDGMVQQMTMDAIRRVSVTRFADFTIDLGGIVKAGNDRRKNVRELMTSELLAASESAVETTGASRPELLEEGHSRLAVPLLGLIAPMIGFSALMLGGFSRFGLWRQIGLAVFLLIVVQAIHTAASARALKSDMGWPLLYLAPLVGLLMVAALLWQADRNRRLPPESGAETVRA